MRDYVDAANCLKLDSFSNDKLSKGFCSEMVEETKNALLINKVMASNFFPVAFLL